MSNIRFNHSIVFRALENMGTQTKSAFLWHMIKKVTTAN